MPALFVFMLIRLDGSIGRFFACFKDDSIAGSIDGFATWKIAIPLLSSELCSYSDSPNDIPLLSPANERFEALVF